MLLAVIVLAGFLVFGKKDINTPVEQSGEYLSGYSFLEEDIPKQDKYLMILGKNMIEDFGTYSKNDTRSLLNLQNQSVDDYKPIVQNIIDTIPDTKDITTSVDPDYIELTYQDNRAIVTARATTEDNVTNQASTHVYTAIFVKQGDYWLVSSITDSKK